MAHISPERKQSVLAKLALPNPPSIAALAKSENISEAALYKWRKTAIEQGLLMAGNNRDSSRWSAQQRFNAVLETAGLPVADVAEYCRAKGLYPEQIERWKKAAIAGCNLDVDHDSVKKNAQERKDDRKKIVALERELNRKEKALAEAAAIVILQKKLASLLGKEDA